MRPEPGHEVPPTAGLPLRLADLLPGGGSDLASALAGHFGLMHPQLASSGTACLVVALRALRALDAQRDAVVVPAYSCPLVPMAIAACGLRTVLCDLRPGSFELDLDHLQSLCDGRTLAVLPTHLCGTVTDVQATLRIAHAAGAKVIEDAAQAMGARAGAAGVGMQGDIGFFSLAAGKGLTTFEGGLMVTPSPAMAQALQRAAAEHLPRSLGWELRRSVELAAYAALYRPSLLGLAYGAGVRRQLRAGDDEAAAGDDFGAAIPLHGLGAWRRSVALRALPRLDAFQAQGRAQWERRRAQLLAAVPGCSVLTDAATVEGALGVRPVLAVLMPDAASRTRALQALWPAGLGVSLPFAKALPDYARYAQHVPHAAPGELPHARDLAARILSISNSPWLDDARFERILLQIRRLIGSSA